MNLLLRGAFFPWDEIRALESQQADICAANVKAGRPRYFASTPAVRIFGPHLPIFDLKGQAIVPSKGGHPLGNGLAVYRPAQCDLPFVKFKGRKCPASYRRACTEVCIMCKGTNLKG